MRLRRRSPAPSPMRRDGLPLIGVALTAAEWRRVGFKIARRNGLSAGGEMFSWLLSAAAPGEVRAVTEQLPPPARVLYKAVWKPRFEKTSRWVTPASGSWELAGRGKHAPVRQKL